MVSQGAGRRPSWYLPGVDRDAITGKLDKLLLLRGDPVKGLPAAVWAENLEGVDREDLVRAAIEVVRSLLVPEWASRRKDDPRPQKALEAAESWLATKSADALAECKAAAKACTAARGETFGDQHRVPEAARGIAWAVGPKESAPIFDALAATEEELLARIALTSEYHLGPQQRKDIVEALRRVLAPEVPVSSAANSLPPAGPAPYSPDGHFELGQVVIHKKFGDVNVTSVGETWIEVELQDGSKKRLAHKP
ncbi:MAG: hypothetical protein JWP97_6591 [Labilithrix sp.]|nr:hypothetical protein [Labilithrix sp.]